MRTREFLDYAFSEFFKKMSWFLNSGALLQLCCKILHPYKTVSIFMNFCWIGNNWRIYYLVGPTTDVLRKQPLLNHKLNATEITAVRQLVTGYRESAAFLLRSADELEHLLQIQPKL